MPFRETDRLLDTGIADIDYNYGHGNNRVQKQHSSYNWKSVVLPLLCALIPFLLWITIFRPYNTKDFGLSLMSTSPLEQKSNLPSSTNLNVLKLVSPSKSSSSSNSLVQSQTVLTSKSAQFPPSKHHSQDPNIFTTSILPKTNTTVYHVNFVVTAGTICPDNFPQSGYLINGQSPGPEIRIKQHSILIVTVTNSLPPSSNVSLTFHFHGIHQRKSFLSDGVPIVTQNPIPPGGTFTHEIDTWPQVGTFFYHAHTGMDIVWLFGPMIIEDNPPTYAALPEVYQYDEDRVFTLNGIYHDSLSTLMERIEGPRHSFPATTWSISINGRSYGNWSNGTNDANNCDNNVTPGYYVTTIQPGKTYRFRFINAASDSLLSCSIDSHSFTVIETDGVYVTPVTTDRLVLTPGQRYSVILKADQSLGNYPISCEHMESSGPRNGIAYLHYEGGTLLGEDLLQEDRAGEEVLPLDRWVIDQLHPNLSLNQTDYYAVPSAQVDKEFVVDVLETTVGEQHVYLINGHFYEEPSTPYFMQLKQKRNITNAPQVFEILEGDTVQIIFQNQRMGDFCFSHPWHVHGHSFHVVGDGPDRYDPIVDGARIQADILGGRKEFMFRDSLTVYANQTVGDFTDGAFCGWAAVRFSAHNPGLWLVHCHVTPHMIMGKKFIIWEHSKEDPYLKGLMSRKPIEKG